MANLLDNPKSCKELGVPENMAAHVLRTTVRGESLVMNRMMKVVLSGGFCLIVAGLPVGAAEPGARLPVETTPAMDRDRIFPRDFGVTLPDGTTALQWETPVRYSRTYYVDQNHPQASDAGEGTAQYPFRTISHAAQVVQTGERVFVKAGIYREEVQPLRGGNGPEKMITFEAEPGHTVIINQVRDNLWEIRLILQRLRPFLSATSPSSRP